ncbi:hypothetical protein DER46DRAFT_648709 [Fusarium sp. MPI-SDFR-AT-0072]|nr:hypothetical protein DER46DRAFT_648709 [Fusarium sp. MPI-SDFR-AT-0072]
MERDLGSKITPLDPETAAMRNNALSHRLSEPYSVYLLGSGTVYHRVKNSAGSVPEHIPCVLNLTVPFQVYYQSMGYIATPVTKTPSSDFYAQSLSIMHFVLHTKLQVHNVVPTSNAPPHHSHL